MDTKSIMDKFGIYFDEVGLSKTYGRLFGYFMTTNEPISMAQLVEKLQISKSTASVEIRRLLSMGAIEKVLLSDSRADFYQLKKNIWAQNLKQKIRDIKKLQSIIEEVPHEQLEHLNHLKEMARYCDFIESELEAIVEKYLLESENTIKPSHTLSKNAFLGDWSGTLDIGIAQINIMLHLSEDSNGTLSGTFDYIEEKIYGSTIDSLVVEDKSLKFQIKNFLVNFEGYLLDESLQISGQWSQHGNLFPLIFEKGKKLLEAPHRPQEPKLPYPYKEEIITFSNQEITLSGTFTLPFSKDPFPVVILISGAGPCDRDGTILGHKPMWILADYLTRQGIAVLRFDKRGCGKSTGNFLHATTEEFAADVLAGIDYLQSREDVDAKHIGLVGHSEGGIIAPMAALRSDKIAYMVLMAACGVNGEEMMCAWSESIEKDKGSSSESIERDRKYKKELFSVLKNEPNFELAAKKLRHIILNHTIKKEKKDELTPFESDAIDAEINYLNTHWLRYFLTYEPAVALRKTQVPVLALHGDLDKQIFSKQNLPAISQALKEAGNHNYKTVELPQLNHIFQTCHDGSFAEYAKIEETISPLALNLIADWIFQRTTT